MGDGEDPGSELALVALEGRQVAEHSEEDLAGQVVGLAAALQPEIAHDHRGQGQEDPLERPGLASARRDQDRPKLPRKPIPPHADVTVIAAPPILRRSTAARGRKAGLIGYRPNR